MTSIGDKDPVIRDWSTHESVTVAVVSAIAEMMEQKPLSIDPLHETIDPDALNQLFTNIANPGQTEIRVEFTVNRCRAIIYGDGRIIVTPANFGDGYESNQSSDEDTQYHKDT